MHVGLTASLALLAAVCAAHEDAGAGVVPFVLGSRYGRGAPGPAALRVLAPRNDRFFMGSRYGKRSELPPDDVVNDSVVVETRAERGAERSAERGEGRGAGKGGLECRYTGVQALYRCQPALGREAAVSLHGRDLSLYDE